MGREGDTNKASEYRLERLRGNCHTSIVSYIGIDIIITVVTSFPKS